MQPGYAQPMQPMMGGPSGMAQMMVSVPAGVAPGQPFQVNANGQVLTVQCPPGAMPGQQIPVQVPPPQMQGAPPVIQGTVVGGQGGAAPVAMAMPMQGAQGGGPPVAMAMPMQ